MQENDMFILLSLSVALSVYVLINEGVKMSILNFKGGLMSGLIHELFFSVR